MKKLIAIIAFFLIIPATAYAQNTPCFEGIRPSVASIEDDMVVVSIPLIPLMGSPNFLQFSKAKSFFNLVTNMRLPDGNTDMERLQGFLNTMNSFHGSNTNLYMMVLPNLNVEVNTKYFEFKLFGGANSYGYAKLHGLPRELSSSDIMVDQNNNPYISGVGQRILELKNANLFGGEAWAIGKVPIKIKNYKLTVLFGVGSAVAYRMMYSYSISLEDTVTVDSGFNQEMKEQHDILWNINAMAGLQFEGFKNLRFRLVTQVRDIYNGYDKRSKPLVDLGLNVDIGKRFGVHMEFYNMANPQFKFEGTFSFLKKSEVAVGGVFNSEVGGLPNSKSPGIHYGYVSLSLGNSVVMWTVMALFNKDSLGALTGLTLGWSGTPKRR
jgi:hypothetical protein